MGEPQWASTDLRWRTTAGNRKDPRLERTIPGRGFIEDYAEEQASKKIGGRFSAPLLNIWRCRHNCNTTIICAIAIATSVMSASAVQSNVVKLASTFSVALSFLILCQRRKLRRLGTLRHQNNELRRHANYFRQERERLHRTLDRLDEQSAELHSVPHELHRLSKNRDVERTLHIIKEQKEVQSKMRDKLNQQIIQQILEVVIREDRDKNFTLRPTEIEALIVRLGLNPAVEVNEQKFREMLLMAPTVSTIMQLIRALLERDDEYANSDPVFRIKTDAVMADGSPKKSET